MYCLTQWFLQLLVDNVPRDIAVMSFVHWTCNADGRKHESCWDNEWMLLNVVNLFYAFLLWLCARRDKSVQHWLVLHLPRFHYFCCKHAPYWRAKLAWDLINVETLLGKTSSKEEDCKTSFIKVKEKRLNQTSTKTKKRKKKYEGVAWVCERRSFGECNIFWKLFIWWRTKELFIFSPDLLDFAFKEKLARKRSFWIWSRLKVQNVRKW